MVGRQDVGFWYVCIGQPQGTRTTTVGRCSQLQRFVHHAWQCLGYQRPNLGHFDQSGAQCLWTTCAVSLFCSILSFKAPLCLQGSIFHSLTFVATEWLLAGQQDGVEIAPMALAGFMGSISSGVLLLYNAGLTATYGFSTMYLVISTLPCALPDLCHDSVLFPKHLPILNPVLIAIQGLGNALAGS